MMRIYHKIEGFVLRIIEKLENQKITLTTWLVSFYAIYLVRALLESYSRGMDYFQFEGPLVGHVFVLFRIPVFMLSAALLLILLLHFLSGEKIERISKLALYLAPFIILIPPVVELVATAGRGGVPMGYLEPYLAERLVSVLDFVRLFFQLMLYGAHGILFFGELPDFIVAERWVQGWNYGMNIRYGFLFLGFIWYIFLKTKNIFRVLLGVISTYFYSFIIAFYLTLFDFLEPLIRSSSLNPSFVHQYNVFTAYFLAVCLLAVLWFYCYSKEKFFRFLKNLSFNHLALNLALLGLGLYLGGVLTFDLKLSDNLLIILAVISLLLYCFSENRIANSTEESQDLSKVFRVISYITAYLAGYAFFVFILLRSAVDYLYRALPFRLKRFPVLASFCQGLAFLFIVYAGFLLIAENTIFDFPGKLALFSLAVFTLGATVKDLKFKKFIK